PEPEVAQELDLEAQALPEPEPVIDLAADEVRRSEAHDEEPASRSGTEAMERVWDMGMGNQEPETAEAEAHEPVAAEADDHEREATRGQALRGGAGPARRGSVPCDRRRAGR